MKRVPSIIIIMLPTILLSTPLQAFRSTLVRKLRPTASNIFAIRSFFSESTDFSNLIQNQPLLSRVRETLKLKQPTLIQEQAYKAIADTSNSVTVGAETGSGKTLAYLLPILDDILTLKAKQNETLPYSYARALILVPNKELIQQLIRMALPLCGGGLECIVFGRSSLDESFLDSLGNNSTRKMNNNSTAPTIAEEECVRLAILPGGLKARHDFPPFRKSFIQSEPPVDIVISTPVAVGPLGLSPKNIDMFADIQTVVVDEADMLLDGGYVQQLNNVFMGFKRADRAQKWGEDADKKTQHVFVAATIPDYGKRSVDAYLQKKFPKATQISLSGMHNALHSGLAQSTQWIQMESKKERMQHLVELLGGELADCDKSMVFLNSVGDVNRATEALQREGIKGVIPYHAKLSLSERTKNLNAFRKGGILVCTDLASRGLDVPGVNVVIQLMFSGNVVSHLHRMGRCGRAGKKTGRGIVFYGEQEAELVDEIRKAETEQSKMVLEGDVDDPEEEKHKVNRAFSRNRSFSKIRKKNRKRYEQSNASS